MSTSTSTEVVPAIQAGLVALKEDPGASVRAVATAMAEPYEPDVARTEEIPFPPLPKPLQITKEVRKALKRLPEVFGKVQPETRRTLTDQENHDAYEEREALKAIEKLLKERVEALNEIIRTHMDVDAEERGVAVPKAVVDDETGEVIVPATDRDAKGHYILCAKQDPERSEIPGENLEWSREFGAGETSFSADAVALAQMEAEGEISRETYLAMTRNVRVFDEDRATAALHDPKHRDSVLDVIRKFTSVGKPHTKLWVRSPKKR